MRRSDEQRVAPGAETLRALFGDAPTLVLLDELSVYLRKVGRLDDARGQLTAFLTSLFKAVESTPNAALVYTLAIGKDGRATDAYSTENQFVADRMAEIESVSARKATLLNPTEEDETVQVLRRRLFEHVDDAPGTPAGQAEAAAGTVGRRPGRVPDLAGRIRGLARRSAPSRWRNPGPPRSSRACAMSTSTPSTSSCRGGSGATERHGARRDHRRAARTRHEERAGTPAARVGDVGPSVARTAARSAGWNGRVCPRPRRPAVRR